MFVLVMRFMTVVFEKIVGGESGVNLFGGTFLSLEKSLDYATVKNRTISNNIANIDTPNYKAQDVDFKQILSSKLSPSIAAKRTHSKHMPFNNDVNVFYQKKYRNNTLYNHNGNNVDIDKEMAELAKNQIYYQSLVDRINGKFKNIQTVIRGGN